jgi:phosphohistidine phosphatase
MTHEPCILVLVRHAKSSWADKALADHDRPLNPRGLRDAPEMARRLKARGPEIQRIVSSSARRALETARIFAEILRVDPREIVIRPAIYGAGVSQMVELIRGLEPALRRVMMVGHNPTFSDLARSLSGEVLDHVPTCSVLTLVQEQGGWTASGNGTFALRDMDYPKRTEAPPGG